VGFGAVFVDTKMANHLPDMAYLDIVKLRKIPKHPIVKLYSSAMRCPAKVKACCAVLQHSHNLAERY
jgi:hypothetical protein